jgi:hypothetical protein
MPCLEVLPQDLQEFVHYSSISRARKNLPRKSSQLFFQYSFLDCDIVMPPKFFYHCVNQKKRTKEISLVLGIFPFLLSKMIICNS